DRIPIFRSIQPMEPWRWRVRFRAAVQFILKPGDESEVLRLFRPLLIRRRHHSGAQLANDFFPFLTVRCDATDIKRVEGEVCGADSVVMTFDAIVVDQRPLGSEILGPVSCGRLEGCLPPLASLSIDDESEQQSRRSTQKHDKCLSFLHEFTVNSIRLEDTISYCKIED